MLSEQQTQTLEQLSAAATQGEWTVELDTRTELCRATGDELSYTAGYDISGTSQVVGCEGILGGPEGEANAAFIVALVNAYRTGQLVAVQADDATVERVARLMDEYRETMDREVLHSWAKDVVAALAAKGTGDD